MKSSRAAFLEKETVGFIFSISQHSIKRSKTARRDQNVKIRACWQSCDDGQLACMASYPKCGPCMGNICSLSFQLLPEGYNFVTWALSTKPARTDDELYDCVHGQGPREEFEAVVHSDPKWGEISWKLNFSRNPGV